MKIKAVLFDFIGTTVIEKDPLTVINSFEHAFLHHGVPIDRKQLTANRGKDKLEMIELLVPHSPGKQATVSSIYESFRANIENSIHNFELADGVTEVMEKLRARWIFQGIGTGMPRDIFEGIFRKLNWRGETFDFTGIAGEIGRPRPHPDMIIAMMHTFGIAPHEFLKVGDTAIDIQEGKNASVVTAAILSGTQARQTIEQEKPDHIIHHLTELLDICR